MSEVISYLNSKGIAFKTEGSEVVIQCPQCGKQKLYINLSTCLLHCFYCEATNPSGDLTKGHLSKLKEYYGDIVPISVTKKIDKKEVNFSLLVERYHNDILINKKALKYLLGRGITVDSIKRFKLGFVRMKEQDWISIPAFKNEIPIFIKYRKLPPDERPDLEKCEREVGGESILFNEDCLSKFEEIYVCEGEIDTITLLQHGYENVVGTTVGAGTLKTEWYEKLILKSKIIMVFDSDQAGQKSARDVWATRLGINKCWNVRFPKREDGSKKDINSYFLTHTKEDFDGLVKSAEQFKVSGVLSLEDTLLEMYRRSQSNYNEMYELPWPSVNRLLGGGIRKGHLMIIGAPPGTGKTSYGIQICYHMAMKYQIPSFIFCMEMPETELACKVMQLHLDLTYPEVNYSDAMVYIQQISELPIYFGYSSKITPDIFYNTMREVRDRYGVGIGMFDNIQRLIRTGEEADMAKASGVFKNITLDLNIPFLLISQPRKVDGKVELTSDDLKGSGALFQDADEIIILHRKRVRDAQATTEAYESKTRVIVDKSRFSSGGSTYLEFLGNKSKFIERGE